MRPAKKCPPPAGIGRGQDEAKARTKADCSATHQKSVRRFAPVCVVRVL
jgi:hypothetical protein